MNIPTEPVSRKALDCFVQAIAHLIDEQGIDRGVETAKLALAVIEEELDGRPLTSSEQLEFRTLQAGRG